MVDIGEGNGLVGRVFRHKSWAPGGRKEKQMARDGRKKKGGCLERVPGGSVCEFLRSDERMDLMPKNKTSKCLEYLGPCVPDEETLKWKMPS
jgi:hypothetical protein